MVRLSQNIFKPKKNVFKAMGVESYDNPRENIDPHIRTKAISTQEGTIQGTPINAKDIVNKEYVDSAGYWDRTLTVLSPKTSGDDIELDGYLRMKQSPIASMSVPIELVNSSGTQTIQGVGTTLIITGTDGLLCDGVFPNSDNAADLGKEGSRWRNLHLAGDIVAGSGTLKYNDTTKVLELSASPSGAELVVTSGTITVSGATTQMIRMKSNKDYGPQIGFSNSNNTENHAWVLGVPGVPGSLDFMVYDYETKNSRVHIKGTSGAVGIHTSTPIEMLDVDDTMAYKNAFTFTLPGNDSSVAVTFPKAFNDTPVCVVCTPGWQTSFWITGLTKTGFTFNVGSTNAYDQTIQCIAMRSS